MPALELGTAKVQPEKEPNMSVIQGAEVSGFASQRKDRVLLAARSVPETETTVATGPVAGDSTMFT